jgi:hypothetical protein
MLRGYEWTQERKKEHFGESASSTAYEDYQRDQVGKATGVDVFKPSPPTRFHVRPIGLYDSDVRLVEQRTLGNIHDFTENFDGKQVFGKNVVYINFKFIVGQGGNQTSRLRDVGFFVKTQMQWLDSTENDGHVYFANVLDGERCAKEFEHFEKLLTLDSCTSSYSQRIFVGDSVGYVSWILSKFPPSYED